MKIKIRKLRIDRVLLVLFGLILGIYLLNIIVKDTIYKHKKYEFQTEYITGIGKECGIYFMGYESCLVGNMIIPVKQYMEVK